MYYFIHITFPDLSEFNAIIFRVMTNAGKFQEKLMERYEAFSIDIKEISRNEYVFFRDHKVLELDPRTPLSEITKNNQFKKQNDQNSKSPQVEMDKPRN